MTHTVLAIVTCFSLTQGPSALVFMYQIVYGSTSALQVASVAANQLVLTGKMLNVVLFCMTSSTFRRKLLQTCKKWIYSMFYCSERFRNRCGEGSVLIPRHNAYVCEASSGLSTRASCSRSRLSHANSKSGITLRTSLMSSWSVRGARSSFMSQVSQR
ncbi:hypothetical protein OESDEN_23807 [Oesophagostomum dentatum]|uniref:Uncharacterized protein n=1 Tax=Oesophagostomum dentatum TaxID=61180 RepID=A0A0B1RU03_OESDE|nr:hypothetical protein OESDEN_23807 [Oesophagostomum dentatum]